MESIIIVALVCTVAIVAIFFGRAVRAKSGESSISIEGKSETD